MKLCCWNGIELTTPEAIHDDFSGIQFDLNKSTYSMYLKKQAWANSVDLDQMLQSATHPVIFPHIHR